MIMNISLIAGLILLVIFVFYLKDDSDDLDDEYVTIISQDFIIKVNDIHSIPTNQHIKEYISEGYLRKSGRIVEDEEIVLTDLQFLENNYIKYVFYLKSDMNQIIEGFQDYQVTNEGDLIEGIGEGGEMTADNWCDEFRMRDYFRANQNSLINYDIQDSIKCTTESIRKVHKAHCIIQEEDGYKTIKSQLMNMNPPPNNQYATFDWDVKLEEYKASNPNTNLCDQIDPDHHYNGEPLIEKCRIGGDQVTYSGCYRSCSDLSPNQMPLKTGHGLDVPDIILPHPEYADALSQPHPSCHPGSSDAQCIHYIDCTEGYYYAQQNQPKLICSTGSSVFGTYDLRNGNGGTIQNTCEQGSSLPTEIRNNPDKYRVMSSKTGEVSNFATHRVNHLLTDADLNREITISCNSGYSSVGGDDIRLENCISGGECGISGSHRCMPNCSKPNPVPSDFSLYDLPPGESYDTISYAAILDENYTLTCSDSSANPGESGKIYCDTSADGVSTDYSLTGCYEPYCEDIRIRDDIRDDDDADKSFVCLQKSFNIRISDDEKDNFKLCNNNLPITSSRASDPAPFYQCESGGTFTNHYNTIRRAIIESSGAKDLRKANGSDMFTINISKMQHLENNLYNVEYVIFCEGDECPELGEGGVEVTDTAMADVAQIADPTSVTISLPPPPPPQPPEVGGPPE